MRWRFVAGIGLALALAVGTVGGGRATALPGREACGRQANGEAQETPTLLVQRVVLLAPSASLLSDPAVQKILAFERAEREKAARKSGSFTLRLPGATGKPPSASTPKTGPATPKTKETPHGEEVNAAQLQTIADTLLADALTERLQRLKIVVVPEAEVKTALDTLKLTRAAASRPEGAEKLQTQLNADAVLTLSPARIRVRERQSRIVALWVTVHIPALRTPQHAFPPLAPHEEVPGGKQPLKPLTEFAVAGAATTGHAFLKSAFARTPPSLARSATDEAASALLHALRAGSVPAFPQEDAQIALAPVPAPTQADQLLFAPEGRKSLPGTVRDLPADLSERFRPDLLPLFPESVRDTGVTQQALRALGLTPDALWEKEQTPNRERVQALGRRLGVGYVLLARITHIEVDAGATPQSKEPTVDPSSPRQRAEAAPSGQRARPLPTSPGSVGLAPVPVPPWERQGRAEAVGALVRVRDGALLWQNRATATMSSRQKVTGEAQIQAANRQAAEDATHFALLQLQRLFRAYRLEAERP